MFLWIFQNIRFYSFIPHNLLIAKLAAYDFEEIDALRHI